MREQYLLANSASEILIAALLVCAARPFLDRYTEMYCALIPCCTHCANAPLVTRALFLVRDGRPRGKYRARPWAERRV